MCQASPRVYTIMPLGDSMTEGGDGFASYRFPLWERLFAAGYVVRYVGSRSASSRIGSLNHEGYSGRNAEFIDQNIDRLYRENPADIVLLAAGFNHDSAEQPIPGILAATQSIIGKIHAIRPDAVVVLAQVNPNGKLPKYAYVPQLNIELAALAQRLDPSGQRILLADLATGYDWTTDTVEDHVHPNARGAAKIADRWYLALTKILPAPVARQAPQIHVYKKTPTRDLALHLFTDPQARAPRPAIIFFFGGGWRHGTPIQFYREAIHFAARGMVAVCADYRIAELDKTTPLESLHDAKSALRWLRAHAAEFGIDPARIAAAGASAGGQLAAAAAYSTQINDPADDLSITPRPDALLLWYAVVDNSPDGYGHASLVSQPADFSPMQAIHAPCPATLFFLGDCDPLIPVATARRFKERTESLGGRCDLHLYKGAGHPIYAYREGESDLSRQIRQTADDFLVSINYLPPRPAPGKHHA